ncbi:MAG: hypothetical protein WB663_10115 [Beijerinckiaceae bacterium]
MIGMSVMNTEEAAGIGAALAFALSTMLICTLLFHRALHVSAR